MDLHFQKYQESWICNELEILVTKKTYAKGHDMMILDYRPGKEPTSDQIREIYNKLSGIQTDALFLTNYNDKTQKVALLEIDLPSFLNDNILQIKLDYNENEEKKKKSDLLPDQPRRNTFVDLECSYDRECAHNINGHCELGTCIKVNSKVL